MDDGFREAVVHLDDEEFQGLYGPCRPRPPLALSADFY
jgi:hypothetical protein